jgi:hypothetical protein
MVCAVYPSICPRFKSPLKSPEAEVSAKTLILGATSGRSFEISFGASAEPQRS